MSRKKSRSKSLVKNNIDAKVVLLGDSGVGKTSLVVRYIRDMFSGEEEPTIGGVFSTKKITVGQYSINLQIWDTAGQERFRSMAPMYYRGATSAILCFDITRKETFRSVQSWVKVLAIACNKCDLEKLRQVPRSKCVEYAESLDAIYLETSAKEDQGIDELFVKIAQKVSQNQRKKEQESPEDSEVSNHLTNLSNSQNRSSSSSSSSCCGSKQ